MEASARCYDCCKNRAASALRVSVEAASKSLSYDELTRLAFVIQFLSRGESADLPLAACEAVIEALERKQ
jgi:hypothetical protein